MTFCSATATGTFAASIPYSVDLAPTAVAAADFNSDGKADLVTSNQTNGTVSVLLGNGDGTFQPAVTLPAGGSAVNVAIGDFNGDGKADLAVANLTPATVSVLIGDGLGGFAAPVPFSSGNPPGRIIAADFNADSKLDLAFGTSSGVGVVLGNGDGTFQAVSNYLSAAGSPIAGDFLGSGNISLAAATAAGVVVLPGLGDGTFGSPVSFPLSGTPFALAVADFNGDGRADLAVPDLTGGNLSILLGQIPQPGVTCNLGTAPVLTGAAYNFPCPATGGVPPYTYSISSGALPTGLSISATTGAISGTPTATGTFNFTVNAADSDTPVQNATFTGSIQVATPLLITGSPLPNGIFGSPYSTTLASGGTAPYTCTLTAGTLPSGLTLNSSTCVLSGVPTLGAVFTFTLAITDSGTQPQSASPTYSLTATYPAAQHHKFRPPRSVSRIKLTLRRPSPLPVVRTRTHGRPPAFPPGYR